MSLIDYLKGAGVIGFIVLIVIVAIAICIAPIIVAVFIANALGVTGLTWWAFVLVIWFVIAGLISFLNRGKN